PDNARGYSNLAAALYHMGLLDEAVSAYRHSIGIQPTAAAYSSLGTVHFFRGQYHEAAAMFEKGAALQPFNPVQWGYLGDAYRWIAGREDRAQTAFDHAISLMRQQLELNPNQAESWAQLASWLAKRGRKREAMHALRRGLRLSPRDVNCMALAIGVHLMAG